MKLFTVGPVACYPEVLNEMRRQMFSHRSSEYQQLHKETINLMKDFLDTTNEVFLFPSSGTGFMEASVRNCVKKKMLICVSGAFGERFSRVAVSNGKMVEELQVERGQPILPDLLDDKLKKCKDVEAVSITHNETSVGLLNPLEELAKVVKDHDKLLFVDAVSSMGGTDIKVDEWSLDICFTSSQKCFGVPPGLALGSVSEGAMKKSAKTKQKGYYFDFKLYEKYQKNSFSPTTPTIPQICGLNTILKIIQEQGGKTSYFETYQKRSDTIRKGVRKMDLTLFPRKGYESPTVTCVNAPSKIGGYEIYARMRDKGFELAKGYGELKDATFRVGNMGCMKINDINSMLIALKTVLE